MKHAESQAEWTERIARAKLGDAERVRLEDWMDRHPGERDALEERLRLTALLDRLPEPTVSSNFTSRVLMQVRRVSTRPRGGLGIKWLRALGALSSGWKAAIALFAVGLAVLGHREYQVWRHAELGRDVAALPIEMLANHELWRDFDEIRLLPSESLMAVEELEAALR